VFEKRDHMLWYPLAYEGQECSKNVFYTGAAPNQQIEPAVAWLLENEKEKAFFLIGADDVYPRTVSEIIQAQLKVKGGEMAGESYVPFGGEVTKLIQAIKKAMPEGGVIFNSLNGDDNVAFFRGLQRAGMGADQYPVMCVNMAEAEIRQIGPEFLVGHYAAWHYFQTVDGEVNEAWVRAFKDGYGRDRVTDAPMAAAYTAVYLWKQAVEAAGTTEISAVRNAAYGQTFEAPGGAVTLRPNHHLSKTARIGKVLEDGLFEIVWTSEALIEPSPWNQYVTNTKGYQCDWSDAAKGGKYKP
ncbi:MAG: transporter substrate-binding protein, partial [Cyanobacteria bacterium J06598_3]